MTTANNISSAPSSPTLLIDPLCIILVKNGSKGDRLLFRYPYKTQYSASKKSKFAPTATPTTNTNANPRRRKVSDVIRQMEIAPSTPFPLDIFASTPHSSLISHGHGSRSSISNNSTKRPQRRSSHLLSARGRSPAAFIFDKSANNSDVFESDEASTTMQSQGTTTREEVDTFADGAQMLNELSDKDLSNLLSVNSELADRKFELKLNYVRFIGHPTLLGDLKSYRNYIPSFQTSVKLFHVVFCLNAVCSHSIVKCYHDLSKRLGIALRHEEYRCGFLTEEFKTIIAVHDEVCTEQSEDKADEERLQQRMFDEILKKSKLAQLLKEIYDDVVEKGSTYARVNDWIQISFCLPQKVHTLKFRDEQFELVEPEVIHFCLEAIRPYHAILLLEDPDELNENLLLDASSTISRLIQVYSPLKSLQTIAADADLTLCQAVEIASHLVYWAQATVIYPLCESNIYVISPNVPVNSEKLNEEFMQKFPELSLSQTLADFSLPMTLGERINPVLGGNYVQAQQVQLVTWLLKYNLLIHIHTYIYLTTYFDGTVADSGMDYLTTLAGSLDMSADYTLNIQPFEAEDEDATVSESFSETTTAEKTAITAIDNDNKRPSTLPVAPNPSTPTTTSSTATAKEPTVTEPVIATANIPELNEAVRRAVSLVKSPVSAQDIKMFSRLSKYFTGEFHIEEIMYRENVRRSQLMLLVDKFRDVLVTIEKEDAEINFFRVH